jgi:hypothetical protein
MYNTRTCKIECPFCGGPMRPFGGRFSPWAADVQEIFLCVRCGYWVDMQQAIAEALVQRAAINRRYENAQRYMGNDLNGQNGARPTLRQWVLRVLVNWLDK